MSTEELVQSTVAKIDALIVPGGGRAGKPWECGDKQR